jgi:hypothetical protein
LRALARRMQHSPMCSEARISTGANDSIVSLIVSIGA